VMVEMRRESWGKCKPRDTVDGSPECQSKVEEKRTNLYCSLFRLGVATAHKIGVYWSTRSTRLYSVPHSSDLRRVPPPDDLDPISVNTKHHSFAPRCAGLISAQLLMTFVIATILCMVQLSKVGASHNIPRQGYDVSNDCN
jgi:hypothetical protein